MKQLTVDELKEFYESVNGCKIEVIEKVNFTRTLVVDYAPKEPSTYYYAVEGFSEVDDLFLIISKSEEDLADLCAEYEYDKYLEEVMEENGWEESMENSYTSNDAYDKYGDDCFDMSEDPVERAKLKSTMLAHAKKLPSNFIYSQKVEDMIKGDW